MLYAEKTTEKEFYINAISDLLKRCNDVSLLDLIYKLLCKSI